MNWYDFFCETAKRHEFVLFYFMFFFFYKYYYPVIITSIIWFKTDCLSLVLFYTVNQCKKLRTCLLIVNEKNHWSKFLEKNEKV